MRMWNVPVELLCRKHLLGEHLEMHMFIGSIKKGTSLKGYIDNGLVELRNISSRHDELSTEMIRRGYNHKSPIEVLDGLEDCGSVDVDKNLEELKGRCIECQHRMSESRRVING